MAEYREGETCPNSRLSLVARVALICAPYWIRFAQCLNRYFVCGDRVKNGANALKYGLSLSLTLMGACHAQFREDGKRTHCGC